MLGTIAFVAADLIYLQVSSAKARHKAVSQDADDPVSRDKCVIGKEANKESGAGMAAMSAGVTPPNPSGPRPSSEAMNSVTASGPRPSAGKKWSEVCEQVQKPDGSVRTPGGDRWGTDGPMGRIRAKRDLNEDLTALQKRSHFGGRKPATAAPSHRLVSAPESGANRPLRRHSCEGSFTRSCYLHSHRSHLGDISSRCSSGCWETSTNSSEPVTDVIPSPMESKGLLMPDPIRTGIIPPALLADEPAPDTRVEHAEQSCAYKAADCETTESTVDTRGVDVSVGMPLRWDPFGRDGVRRQEVKSEWTPDSLAKYLKGVAVQIDNNLTHGRLPTVERLDAFVSRLVLNSQRQLKHAPKKVRHRLQATFALRFQTFWNFSRNEKVRNISPEELKGILTALVEEQRKKTAPHTLAQPKPLRYYSYGQLRPAVDAAA
eukprot:g2633.t1